MPAQGCVCQFLQHFPPLYAALHFAIYAHCILRFVMDLCYNCNVDHYGILAGSVRPKGY